MDSTNCKSPVERAMDYARQVEQGQITACEKVKLACRRFLGDLERSEDPAYPWVFDEALAARPTLFMERYLVPTKGDYDRLTLLDWQCFVEANLYGWVDRHTRLRRFREGLIVVGSGNGKSTMMSGNATYGACKDGERGAEIYLLANSREQAGIVFEECREQIKSSPALAPRFRALRDGVWYDATKSKIRSRSSDSTRLDGLNPHLSIFDEIHEYRDYKLINAIKKKMPKRLQPLLIYITTMGTVLDGPLVELYNLFSMALEGGLSEAVSDRLFTFIAELDAGDDVEDSSLWIKANPSLGKLLLLDTLQQEWARAKAIPQERANFICKQLNVMVDNKDAAFVDKAVLDRNQQTISMESLLGRRCYGGFDLSTREDFTAAALEFPLEDGRFFVLLHSWVPQKKVNEDHEKIPYYEWAMQGCLDIVPGDYIEQELVYEWFCEQVKQYEILCIGYDPANAVRLRQMLDGRGFRCSVVRQGPLTLNDPMKDIKELLLAGKVVSNNDPMLRWYIGNVKISGERRHADKENWMPQKRNKYRKIDGFIAWLCAHTVDVIENPAGQQHEDIAVHVYTVKPGRRATG